MNSNQFQPPARGEAPEIDGQGTDQLSSDEPLPQSYGSDSVNLLVQSPERIYLYWQHARPPAATLREAFGDGAAGYRPAVRLVDVESGEAGVYEASADCAQWFEVRAGRAYRADIGLAAPERPFIRILSSGVARTPSRSVSQRTDSAAEFRVPAENFARLLGQAGYAEDAAEVAREAALEAGGADDLIGSLRRRERAWAEFEGGVDWKASDVNSGARTSAARLRAGHPQPF